MAVEALWQIDFVAVASSDLGTGSGVWILEATRATDGALGAAIDEALASMRADGRFAALARGYGVPLHEPFATTYSRAALHELGSAD